MIIKKISARAAALLFASGAVFLSGCASSGRRSSDSRPQWADGESADFPRSRYITGVGSADDESSAAERARGEVAKVFSADVSVASTVSESESNSSQNGKEAHSFSNDVAQKVRTTTQKVLEGVNIVARWKDPTGRYYALAALPKDEAELEITEKSAEIDKEAAQYKDALAAATEPFARAKAAAKLLALAKAQASLAADSRVLGGGTLGGVFDGAGSARAQAAQALAALDVVVSVTGDGSDAVQAGVVSGLNAAGLSAKSGAAGDKADLTVTAQVTMQDQDTNSRWYRSRSSAIVNLQDGRSGKTFSTFDVTAREDATDQGEARRRSLVALSKSAAAKVTAAINDFFANQ